MTAPQPSWNALTMTLRFVPGGPDPITNGFGSFKPSTVVFSVGITLISNHFRLQIHYSPIRFYTACAAHCHNNFTRGFASDNLVPEAMSALNPKRTVAELKELRSLTGDANGAQRV